VNRLHTIWNGIVSLIKEVHRSELGEFTVVGWQESVDPDDTLTNLAACADQHVTVSGDRIFVPDLNKLVGEYVAQADGMYHGQLQSPSLRRVALLDVAVLQEATDPTAHESFQPHFDCPIELEVDEGIEALVNKPADGAVVGTVVAFLANGALSPVVGEIFTVRFTATITSILTTWVNGAITLSQTLPVGRYAVVGANVFEDGGDLIAFRLVVAGYPWRAGGICTNAYGSKPIREQRYGRMGTWCEFDSVNPPTLDIIAAAAAAQTIVGYLDLIKIG
jgi:hypothetical protein